MPHSTSLPRLPVEESISLPNTKISECIERCFQLDLTLSLSLWCFSFDEVYYGQFLSLYMKRIFFVDDSGPPFGHMLLAFGGRDSTEL